MMYKYIYIVIYVHFILKGKCHIITLSLSQKKIHMMFFYLSTRYVQLLFRCSYSVGSSVDYQDSLLFRGFTFNTVFVALGPQQS